MQTWIQSLKDNKRGNLCQRRRNSVYLYSLQKYNKESVLVKEHTYKEEVTKASTFEEEGKKTFICEFCKDSYVDRFLLGKRK